MTKQKISSLSSALRRAKERQAETGHRVLFFAIEDLEALLETVQRLTQENAELKAALKAEAAKEKTQ